MTGSASKTLLSIDAARTRMAAAVTAIGAIETVPLSGLLGRVLADTLVSPRAMPPTDHSAMDGYALRHRDLAEGTPLRVIGRALAGQPFAGTLGARDCVRITTGAAMPAGADTVVIQENVEREGDRVRLGAVPPPGANVRRGGEDIARGDTLLTAGRRLGATDLGLLASLGISEATVYRRLRVALIATGDELKTPGSALGPGEIHESNRALIGAMLARLGAEVVDLGIVADDPLRLRAAFAEAAARADAVIASGGASVGEADYSRELLAELGTLGFWQVAIKPGKPFLFGRLGDSVFFGLPGNPVSALVTFHQLAVPVLRQLAGEIAAPALALTAATTAEIRRQRTRVELLRGRLHSGADGRLRVTPDPKQGSAALSSLARSNAFIWVEAGTDPIAAGAPVRVLPFDELLR